MMSPDDTVFSGLCVCADQTGGFVIRQIISYKISYWADNVISSHADSYTQYYAGNISIATL